MRWLVACPTRLSSSASLRMLLHVHRRGDSGLSFGLFRDPETPENRGFLVYLGLLGLRGSSGTARKQPESTKLGPRKSESLVWVASGHRVDQPLPISAERSVGLHGPG